MHHKQVHLQPQAKWIQNYGDVAETVNFPILDYKLIDAPIIGKNNLKLGGSYTYFHYLPMHNVRCAILEKQFMPYELDGPTIKVRNGVLLWPRTNTCAYTDLDDPKVVYLRQPSSSGLIAAPQNFAAKLTFYNDHIELIETRNPNNVDKSHEKIENLNKIHQFFT